MKTKEYKGITLIALIITIIVLLILAGVSIAMVVGDNGVLGQAINASVATDVADTKEQIELALIGYYDENGYYSLADLKNAVKEVTGNELDLDTGTVMSAKNNEVDVLDLLARLYISTTESYVGYYADIEGDGIVDGVIYADLVHSAYGSWGGDSYYYSWVEINKNYYISQIDYIDDFGTADVISPIGTGNNRFYVMALDDFTKDGHTTFYYYNSGSYTSDGSYSSYFGQGMANTSAMLEKWKNSEYGSQSSGDVWKYIQDEVDDGWFIPSVQEWACFGACVGLPFGRCFFLGRVWFFYRVWLLDIDIWHRGVQLLGGS